MRTDPRADQDGAGVELETGRPSSIAWAGYVLAGIVLGIVFAKSEVMTWYRMQEMFRFQSFHMYGIIGTAVVVAAIGQMALVRMRARALTGEVIAVSPKVFTPFGVRYWAGGAVFGMGWALLGACPGPIFTLIGAGHLVYVVPLASAVAGTYLYGLLMRRLPH